MKEPDDGGQAFPVLLFSEGAEGMSLRDYFATRAMAALIDQDDSFPDGHDYPARLSYMYADAMLKARSE